MVHRGTRARRPSRTAVMYRATNASAQLVELGMNEGARVHDGRRTWRLLRTNPDYVTDFDYLLIGLR